MKKHYSGYLCGLMLAVGGLAATTAVSAQGAGTESSRPVLSLYHVEVKHGESRQWREGVKALKACYAEQKGEHSWWTWSRQDGPGTVYTVVMSSPNWADFDKSDDKMAACRPIFEEKLNPHEITVSTQYIRPHRDLYELGTGPIARVTGLVVNDYDKFMEVAKVVTETQKAEKKGSREWYNTVGGASDSEDLLILRRYPNYAALDEDNESLWEMMTRVHGEEKAKALRAQAAESIDSSWNYLYEYKADLSYEPAK